MQQKKNNIRRENRGKRIKERERVLQFLTINMH
jgi:hypothetical protein